MFQIVTQQQINTQARSWPVFFESFSQEAQGFFIDQHMTETGKTFLFCEPSLGPIGGATVTKRNIKNFQPKAQAILKRLAGKDEIWECSNVFFMIPDDSPIHENLDRFSALCEQFYRGLYECLCNFSAANNVRQMMALNFSDEHQDIKFFGRWPFRYEIETSGLFHDEADEFVLGLLEMNTISYQEFQQS